MPILLWFLYVFCGKLSSATTTNFGNVDKRRKRHLFGSNFKNSKEFQKYFLNLNFSSLITGTQKNSLSSYIFTNSLNQFDIVLIFPKIRTFLKPWKTVMYFIFCNIFLGSLWYINYSLWVSNALNKLLSNSQFFIKHRKYFSDKTDGHS